jgi:hypothetical protein
MSGYRPPGRAPARILAARHTVVTDDGGAARLELPVDAEVVAITPQTFARQPSTDTPYMITSCTFAPPPADAPHDAPIAYTWWLYLTGYAVTLLPLRAVLAEPLPAGVAVIVHVIAVRAADTPDPQ